MINIEPFYNWEVYYLPEEDSNLPFYGEERDMTYCSHDIYGYYIHPSWDPIGSETLFLKVLYADYKRGFSIIELMGEWNDTLHNDVMYLKRNLVDKMLRKGIDKFILIGENVLNFHGSDDCYYEEWFQDIEDGWIAALNFRYFVHEEWEKYNLDFFLNYGGPLDVVEWRTLTPVTLYQKVNNMIVRRLEGSQE